MKGSAVIACLCWIINQTSQNVTYDGNQLWNVANDRNTTLKLLKRMENERYLTVWGLNSTKADVMVNAKFLKTVEAVLLENDLEYTVAIDDIQRVIDEENSKPPREAEGRRGYRLTWKYYHSLDDIYEYLHYAEQHFPELCTVHVIGRSVEDRPIKLLKISNKNPNNKAIFVEGGIHAREWISPAAVTYIINQFVGDFEKRPASIKNVDWYIVPVLNPDGYVYSYGVDRLWRKNRSKYNSCIGVDLNRNFGYDWTNGGSSKDPCSAFYRGRRPFSEPETAAVANLFVNNPNIDWTAYVAVHSYGQYVLYPWGAPDAILEDRDELHRIATEAATRIAAAGGRPYAVGSPADVLYRTAGISMDWARGSAAVKYPFTIELGDDGTYGFLLPATMIKTSSEDAVILAETVADAMYNYIEKYKN